MNRRMDMTIRCENCGMEFHPWRGKRRRFCCLQCKAEWWRKEAKRRKEEKGFVHYTSRRTSDQKHFEGRLRKAERLVREILGEIWGDEVKMGQLGERVLGPFPRDMFESEYDCFVDKIAEMVLGRR